MILPPRSTSITGVPSMGRSSGCVRRPAVYTDSCSSSSSVSGMSPAATALWISRCNSQASRNGTRPRWRTCRGPARDDNDTLQGTHARLSIARRRVWTTRAGVRHRGQSGDMTETITSDPRVHRFLQMLLPVRHSHLRPLLAVAFAPFPDRPAPWGPRTLPCVLRWRG